MATTTPEKPQPRPYQLEAVEAIRERMRRGDRRVLFQLPTGGGKSVIMSAVMDGSAARGKRVLATVHRKELVGQLVGHFTAWGHPPHVLAAGGQDDPSARVTVASVQTAAKRDLSKYDLVMVDEAHHACAGTWDEVLRQQEGAHVLGVTATPRRLDGRGLNEHFDCLVQGPSYLELAEGGYLAPIKLCSPDVAQVRGIRLTASGEMSRAQLMELLDPLSNAGLDAYQEHCAGQPVVAFCCTVEHARYFMDRAVDRRVLAGMVHGGMSPRDREQVLRGYREGEIKLLVSVDLIDEGFDVPDTAGVLLMRPTESLTKHFQQVGRASRPKGGAPAVVLDIVRNTLGTPGKEGRKPLGLPDAVQEWTLDGRVKKVQVDALADDELLSDGEQLEKATTDPRALIGRAKEVGLAIRDAKTWREAMGHVAEPKDFVLVWFYRKASNGLRFSEKFIVGKCAERFFEPTVAGWSEAISAMGWQWLYREFPTTFGRYEGAHWNKEEAA